MGKRQKEWARRKRAEMVTLLGSKCATCGAREELSFDCIVPQGHRHHTFDTSARMSFYRAQYRVGNLQLLCDRCNTDKSLAEHPRHNESIPEYQPLGTGCAGDPDWSVT
jgi:hypothetical protein